MKKFLVKGITALLLITVNSLLLNSLYKNTNHWKDENNVKKFFTMPYNVQLGNVGSSHTEHGLKYDTVPEYTCANLAISYQFHDMSYLALKEYIDHFAENAVLLIPISYFEVASRGSNFYLTEMVYYRILDSANVPNYSYKKDLKYDYFPILTAGENLKKILKDIPANEDNFVKKSYYSTDEYLKEYSNLWANKWCNIPSDKKLQEDGFLYNQHAVAKIIDLCHEHNIKPVLITTPITDVLNEYFDNHESFFDIFYHFIDAVQAKYPDVLYFDYSHDERFSPNHTLFCDGDHLNKWGAEKFTPIVVSDLEKAGLLVK